MTKQKYFHMTESEIQKMTTFNYYHTCLDTIWTSLVAQR